MRNALLIISLLATQNVLAQNDTRSNWRLGAASHASYNRYLESIAGSLVFTATHKKSQLEIGPKYAFYTSNTVKSQFGTEFNYRYYPNGISNRFDLQFLINSDYYRLVIEKPTSWTGYTDNNQVITKNFINLNAGFGLFVNLWKGFYLNTDLAAGLQLEATTTENGTSSDKAEYSDKYIELGFRAEFGLGYRFK